MGSAANNTHLGDGLSGQKWLESPENPRHQCWHVDKEFFELVRSNDEQEEGRR